jgi:hypothetical protein
VRRLLAIRCVASSLGVALQRYTSILCMYGTIVAQEQVATHKGATALEAFEGAFLGI